MSRYVNANLVPLYLNTAACEQIKSMPTADVQEVRHGKWIYNPNGMDFNIGAWVCSECQQRNNNLPCSQKYKPSNFVGSNFCPNCGAKIDKKD